MGNNKIKLYNYVEKFQIFCLSMFILLWYINETRQTGKIYAIFFLVVFAFIEILEMIKVKKIYFCKPLCIFLVFAVYCSLSYIWAINGEEAIPKGIDVFLEFGFIFLGLNFFLKIKNGTSTLLYIITILGIIFSIYVINFYGIGQYFKLLAQGRRVGGEVANVNAIGLKTSISFLLCIFFGMYENKKSFYILSTIPFIVSLGTGSKKVILIIGIGLILLFYRRMKYVLNWKQVLKLVITIVIIVSIVVYIAQLPYFSRVFNRMNEMTSTLLNDTGESGSTRIRELFIKVGLKTFWEHPLIGIGAGNSGHITITVSSMYTYLHNNYVELLATLGIIGFLLYYYSYYYVIYNYLKYRKYRNKYYDIVFIIFMVNLVSEVGLVSYASIGTCLYLLLGYLVFHNKNDIKNIGENNE